MAIRVAVIGVGNCASSLVQGVHYYRDAREDDFIPGLMHVNLGGYHVRDIEFSADFDVDKDKVGKDLGEAIYLQPSNSSQLCDVPKRRVTGSCGVAHCGIGQHVSQVIEKAPGSTNHIV